MTRPEATTIFILIVILVLYGVYTYQVIHLGSQDPEYTRLQEEIERYKKSNLELKNKVLQKRSYHSIHEEALKYGFIPITPKIIVHEK